MPQPVVHFEVIGKDPARLRNYFGELFGRNIRLTKKGRQGCQLSVPHAEERHSRFDLGGGRRDYRSDELLRTPTAPALELPAHQRCEEA